MATIDGTRNTATTIPLIMPQHEPQPDAERPWPRDVGIRCVGQDLGDREGDQADDRLDREVDVAGDHDHRLADRRDRR